MTKAVRQRARHGPGYSAVLCAVACGHEVPTGGHLIEGTEAAIEDEFVRGDLQRPIGGGELVEEDDAAARRITRPLRRHQPINGVSSRDGQSAQVDGFTLRETDIHETYLFCLAYLAHDGALPYAGRAPQHHRRNHGCERGLGPQQLELVQHQRADIFDRTCDFTGHGWLHP